MNFSFSDPRITNPRSSNYVPIGPRIPKTSVPVVASTKLSLSERFQKNVSHNPLRPNFGFTQLLQANEARVKEQQRKLEELDFNLEFESSVGLGEGVNKLAVLKAAKDAEIIKLRAELRNIQQQLNSGGGRQDLRSIQKNRGGVVRKPTGNVGPKGRQQIKLTKEEALAILEGSASLSSVRNKRDRGGDGGRRNKGRRNFDDSPKTKSDLDAELDTYMSKIRKNGDSTPSVSNSLDDELDAYMAVARAKAAANKSDEITPQKEVKVNTDATPATVEVPLPSPMPLPLTQEEEDESEKDELYIMETEDL